MIEARVKQLEHTVSQLDVLDRYVPPRTNAAVTGGVTTSVGVDSNLDTALIGAYAIVGAWSEDAEIATVTGVDALTSVAATFANSHSSGVPIVILQDDFLPVRLFGGATAAALNAACTAATAAGIPYVLLPAGTIDVGNGFSMSGYSCGLVGQGSEKSILDASTATGFVLDLTGWTGSPGSFVGNVLFGGFGLEGNGTGDATLAEGGLKISGTQTNLRFQDIAVSGTGGPCVYLDTNTFFCTFDKLTLQRPIDAGTNDVPYLHMVGAANANTFNDLLLRSTTTAADGSAVVLMEDNGTFGPTGNVFSGPMMEFQHTPDNGSVFEIVGGIDNTIDNLREFDSVAADSSPTGNCYIRFKPATGSAQNIAGNRVTGYIPGRGTNADALQYGIIDEQGGNMAIGVKGFRGNNFRITYTGSTLKSACILLGAVAAATDDAFSYGAGVAEEHHYLFDAFDQQMRFGEATLEGNFDGSFPAMILKATTANNVYLRFGSGTGPGFRFVNAISGVLYTVADQLIVQDTSGTEIFRVGTSGALQVNDGGTMKAVSFGANDSGGSGFKVLRIAN